MARSLWAPHIKNVFTSRKLTGCIHFLSSFYSSFSLPVRFVGHYNGFAVAEIQAQAIAAQGEVVAARAEIIKANHRVTRGGALSSSCRCFGDSVFNY